MSINIVQPTNYIEYENSLFIVLVAFQSWRKTSSSHNHDIQFNMLTHCLSIPTKGALINIDFVSSILDTFLDINTLLVFNILHYGYPIKHYIYNKTENKIVILYIIGSTFHCYMFRWHEKVCWY